MYNILGLVGPSGCGKDTAANYLAMTDATKFHFVRLCTTRPKRDTETGKEYFFLDNTEFLKKVLNGTMLNAQEFREWYYGLSIDGLEEDKINVMPMSNIMVQQMREEKKSDINLKIIYITTRNKERLFNLLSRENYPDCKEICRRFLTDYDDYIDNRELIDSCNCFIENHYNNKFYESILNCARECFW